MKDTKLNISMPKFGTIEISMGDEKYGFNLGTRKGHEEIINFLESVTELSEWASFWSDYINAYKNFETECDKQIKKTSDGFEFLENFAIFLDKQGVKNNSEAKDFFETDYAGFSHFTVVNNTSHLVIKSKDKKSLKKFILWNYEKHVKHALKDIKSTKI